MTDIGLKQGQLVVSSSQSAVDVKQLPTILLRRRSLVLGVSCVVMSVASILAFNAKPIYQSSMQILVSSNLSNELRQESTNSKFDNSSFEIDYATQLRLMLSSKLVARAVDILRPEYLDITVEDIKGKQAEQGPLIIAPVEGKIGAMKTASQIFEISYRDSDPVKTQKVLQALQEVYYDYNLEREKQRFDQGLAFLQELLPKVKRQVAQAEQNLEQFRKKNNLLDPEEQGKILLQSLAETKKQLQATRAQIRELQARQKVLEQELASLPQKPSISSNLNQSTRYQILLNEIQKTELALSEQRQRYTDDSPIIQRLMQQRESQMALLKGVAEQALSNKVEQTTATNSPPELGGIEQKLVDDLNQVKAAIVGLRATEKSLTESEQQTRAELSKYPSLIAEFNRLQPEVDTYRKTFENLLQAQQSLGVQIAQAGFNWQLLEEPQRGIYLGSNRLLFVLGGALIGPILGVLAALIWELSRDAVYSPKEFQRLTNLPLLGTVPKLPKHRRNKGLLSLPFAGRRTLKSNLVEEITSLPFHETLDMAYQNIQIGKSTLPWKSLMVTSALPEEGKTTVAMGLAASAARMHRRVLLIDANLRHPKLHRILDLSNDWGLSLLLLEETNTSFKQYIQPVHPTIDVLTAGPVPEDVVHLLSSRRMKELLNVFEQNYDLVLIDTPPILGTVDARIIAAWCNAIVMVGRIGQTTRMEIMTATEILHELNLIGIIANQASKLQISNI